MNISITNMLIVLLISIISPSAHLKNKHLKAIYTYTYKLTFTPDSINRQLLQDNMTLIISDTLSEFVSLNKLKRDSIINSYNSSRSLASSNSPDILNSILQIPKPKFTYIIYKKLRKNVCLLYDEIGREHFYYLENNFPCKWKIQQATEFFMGYNCQKATTSFGGREYEAWFTREIPISDGPYKFSGLPGLIVKIHDFRNNYSFELIETHKSKDNEIISINKSTLTTKEGLTKAIEAHRFNMLNGIEQNGVTYTLSEDAKNRMREKQKRNNNPIELR